MDGWREGGSRDYDRRDLRKQGGGGREAGREGGCGLGLEQVIEAEGHLEDFVREGEGRREGEARPKRWSRNEVD